MQKTGIEWVKNEKGEPGYTWNPIAGCNLNCPYCYAKIKNGSNNNGVIFEGDVCKIENSLLLADSATSTLIMVDIKSSVSSITIDNVDFIGGFSKTYTTFGMCIVILSRQHWSSVARKLL